MRVPLCWVRHSTTDAGIAALLAKQCSLVQLQKFQEFPQAALLVASQMPGLGKHAFDEGIDYTGWRRDMNASAGLPPVVPS